MKRLQKSKQACIAILILILFPIVMNSQEEDETKKNTASFELGSGLDFSFNEGNYQFNIGGFIQPKYQYEKIESFDAENEFNVRHAFLIISGKALKEKVSFLIQNDFSLTSPLMEAWVAYHPIKQLTFTIGQKQTFLNNREMIFREDKFQFTDRSIISQTFSNTGREFGIFVESKFGNKFGIAPMIALTSGDGRNSFGSSSRDVDLGGLKFGGRLDLYPLGYFSEGNELYSADIMHEQKIKFVVGSAISQNNGASGSNGEGHGDFLLYDDIGNENLPDYSQIYVDFLLKYKGFSFLGEYVNSSASNLERTYTDDAGNDILAPEEISEYLILGDGYNFQAGYVTKNGYSIDFRYALTKPEFQNSNSILFDSDSYTFGFTKYFKSNNLKIQASFTSINVANGNNKSIGELIVQIVL